MAGETEDRRRKIFTRRTSLILKTDVATPPKMTTTTEPTLQEEVTIAVVTEMTVADGTTKVHTTPRTSSLTTRSRESVDIQVAK